MANIYDVAKRAKVAVSTVSAVVNESTYVSPELTARVTAAIQALHYQPNDVARSLVKRKSYMLGMVVPDIANPFWPEVVRGAEDEAHQAGYVLILLNTDSDQRKEELYLTLFLAKRVDGILLSKAPGPMNPTLLTKLAAANVPVALLTRECPGLAGDAVLLDDRRGAYDGVSHLLRLGYRRVGMINGTAGVTTTRRRSIGYREALRDWGVPVDRRLYYEGDFRVTSGYRAGLRLLTHKPDAVFIANYLMAVGFMNALRERRLRCPEDVAVVTCDDHPWLDAFTPRLTTIDFPKYDLGREAARVLIDRLKVRGPRPAEILELKGALTIRESCGALLARRRAKAASASPLVTAVPHASKRRPAPVSRKRLAASTPDKHL